MCSKCSAVFAAAIAVMLFVTGTGAAQGTAEGSIAGTVTDHTNAVLPDATVTATNLATGLVRETVTDVNGQFHLPALAPGAYEVVAAREGFSSATRAVTITVGGKATLSIVLSIAGVAEAITVTDSAPIVETRRAAQGATILEQEVRNLPVNSRNFLEFALLAPGAVRGRTSGAGIPNATSFSASGNRSDQNAINVDGMVYRALDGGWEPTLLSQEAVREFQVITQSAPAEYGGTAGGVINAVTKSGTNRLSGYGFFFLRHNAFDRPPFDLRAGPDGVVTAVSASDAKEFQRRVAGFTVGGPIRRDRAFFFGVLDRTDRNEPRVRTLLPSTIDLVRRLALPEMPDNESNRITQFKPTSTKTSAKVDVNVSRRHSASFRLSTIQEHSPEGGTASGLTSVYSPFFDLTFAAHQAGGALNSFLSDRAVNTFRLEHSTGRARFFWPHRGGLDNILNWDAGIIIGGASGGTFGSGGAGVLTAGGFETQWEMQDSVTMSLGRHTVKLGGHYLFAPYFNSTNDAALGVWRFSDLNAFQAGVPSSFSQAFGPSAAYMKPHLMSGFLQDEWQPRTDLTINYGLRYEYAGYPTDLTDFELAEPIVDPSTGSLVTRNSSRMGGFRNDTNNIAPRLGVAWALDDKTVLRAGAGLYYGTHYFFNMAAGIQWSSPLRDTYTFTAAEAQRLWASLRNPASPVYNNGELRLAPSYLPALQANATPLSFIRHDFELQTPQSAQASLGIERQLTGALSAQVALLWSRGQHNVRVQDVNPQPGVRYPAGSRLPSGTIAAYDVDFGDGLRADSRFGSIPTLLEAGDMKYKGLSTSLLARWSALQLRGAYSWNDTWDDSARVSQSTTPADNHCESCEWSRSELSTTHSFRGAAVYQLPASWPFYARDWQVATTVAFESGHPFPVVSGFDFNNDGFATDRPLGVPRNSLWTDGFQNVDLRISRFVPVGGRTRLEVMFEMFNLFNTPRYTNYLTTLYVFDRSQSRFAPRADFAAFAATPQLNLSDSRRSHAEIGLDRRTRRSAVDAPFQGQLGLRLHF